jgi:small-conductance mechanosensitive channel
MGDGCGFRSAFNLLASAKRTTSTPRILATSELCGQAALNGRTRTLEGFMDGLIYLVGLVVVVLAVLSFFGLR